MKVLTCQNKKLYYEKDFFISITLLLHDEMSEITMKKYTKGNIAMLVTSNVCLQICEGNQGTYNCVCFFENQSLIYGADNFM